MIREALLWLEDKVTKAQEKEQIKIHDDIYTEKKLSLVLPHVNKCKTLEFNNLSMLITNIKNELKNQHRLPLILNVSEQSVKTYTSYDINKEREIPFIAVSNSPEIIFNRYIFNEEMIIQLLTCFDDTPNRNNLIKLLSTLSQDQKITFEDDGFTQKVTAKEGVSLQTEVVISPLVKLVPQRTFFEVKQPEQMFLIRVDKRGQVALFDAAGGSWKALCQASIIEYLKAQFEKEIEDKLIIIG